MESNRIIQGSVYFLNCHSNGRSGNFSGFMAAFYHVMMFRRAIEQTLYCLLYDLEYKIQITVYASFLCQPK
jgi:hypothetical protein